MSSPTAPHSAGHPESAATSAHRLAHAASPYLRAHAGNPVDWYTWGDEAFARARTLDLPVFLSVGYSACHWCHVMAHESFESPAIAAFLNAHFVPIKVDRQERPDLDAIYMRAVQAMTGSGGWPMSVFLTPDLKPFYGGTYFPPEDRWGHPGFLRVLTEITRLWRSERQRLLDSAAAITAAVQPAPRDQGAAADEAVLAGAAASLVRSFDREHGGFGGAPKFPPCMALEFLLRRALRTGDRAWLVPCLLTLDQMAAGGIYDHLGGGFHRYSVDAHWQVPHFEKMLYDNALLVPLYSAAWQITGQAAYAQTVRETLTFLGTEMRAPEGAFFAALDADSEGEEGRFYVWRRERIAAALGADAPAFLRTYGLTDLPHAPGEGVLHRTTTPAHAPAPAPAPGLDEALRSARDCLLRVRAARPRPDLDDQILTNWNGLALSAFARAAAAFGDAGWLATAQTLAAFLLGPLRPAGHLCHSCCAGVAGAPANLDDYAFVAQGLLDLYSADADSAHVRAAGALANEMLARFFSPTDGTFYFTEADRPDLITRQTCETDEALPAPAAVAAHVLLRLGALMQNSHYSATAHQALAALVPAAASHPAAYMAALNALDDLVWPAEEVTIAGPPLAPATTALLAVVRQHWNPGRLLVQWDPSNAAGSAVAKTIPAVLGRGLVDGRPAAYVCRNRACLAPVTTAAELRQVLGS